MDSKNKKYVLALLGGAAAGAVLAVLFAPSKGSDFRSKLSTDFTRTKDELSDYLCKFTKSAEEILSKFR